MRTKYLIVQHTYYNEQYLSTFEDTHGGGKCHDGPIYRIAFSPHWPDIFLTCSADWTMSLFHSRQRTALFKLHATGEDHGVQDICWCPGNSTIFAAVTDAKLQVWDLSISSIDPVVNLDTSLPTEDPSASLAEKDAIRAELKSAQTDSRPGTSNGIPSMMFHSSTDDKSDKKDSAVSKLLKNLLTPSTKKTLTCVKFGERSPTLVVGDSTGIVTVYRLTRPVSVTLDGPLQQLDKLKKSIFLHTDPERASKLQDTLNRASSSAAVVEVGSGAGVMTGGLPPPPPIGTTTMM